MKEIIDLRFKKLIRGSCHIINQNAKRKRKMLKLKFELYFSEVH